MTEFALYSLGLHRMRVYLFVTMASLFGIEPCLGQSVLVCEELNSNRVTMVTLAAVSLKSGQSSGEITLVNPRINLVRGEYLTFTNRGDEVVGTFHKATVESFMCSETENPRKNYKRLYFDTYDLTLNADCRLQVNDTIIDAKSAPSRFPLLPAGVERRSDINDAGLNNALTNCDITVRDILSYVKCYVDAGNVTYRGKVLDWSMFVVSSVSFLMDKGKEPIVVYANIKLFSASSARDLDADTTIELYVGHGRQVERCEIYSRPSGSGVVPKSGSGVVPKNSTN